MASMVARWRPSVVLQGLVVAALVAATAQAATVTIYNPAGLVMNIQNDDKNVKSAGSLTGSLVVTIQNDSESKKNRGAALIAVDFTQAQQNFQFLAAHSEAVDVTVHDGDVFVVIPDPADDSGHAIKAFKVLPDGAVVPPRTTVASIPQYDMLGINSLELEELLQGSTAVVAAT